MMPQLFLREWLIILLVILFGVAMKTFAWREERIFRNRRKLPADEGTLLAAVPEHMRYMIRAFTHSSKELDDNILNIAAWLARVSWLAAFIVMISRILFPRR